MDTDSCAFWMTTLSRRLSGKRFWMAKPDRRTYWALGVLSLLPLAVWQREVGWSAVLVVVAGGVLIQRDGRKLAFGRTYRDRLGLLMVIGGALLFLTALAIEVTTLP